MRLTKEQAAIVGAYTGYAVGPFKDVHEYAEKVLSRPVFTVEFADKRFTEELRAAAKADFVGIAYLEEDE